ncbi:MAG: coniferyl aldehyde dehydrogenase [Endozoicomonas sp. (ex Botrylloides leachii)]|nr:coniferyl aldehyde dehydrogenase [Endozoicomonas sp. (ex Botrylloides leachii)]
MNINMQDEAAPVIEMVPSQALTGLTENHLNLLLKSQQQAFIKNPAPSLKMRVNDLQRLKTALINHQDELITALNKDFGARSRDETIIIEFMPVLEGIKYTLKHLKKWLNPSKRHVSIQLQPAQAKVVYQPLGVVGIVVPWNYPLMLSASPLVSALAAGNRAMIKMSEYTPKTSALFADIIRRIFPADQVTVVNGGADLAAIFTQLKFDHLLFTGSTPVGRQVMSAAAKNLTPVTLELGGKSPVIINDDFPIKEVAQRICSGKSVNAGQTCIAPDYVLVKKSQRDDFVKAYINAFNKMYPKLNNNNDYSAIINNKQYQRLQRLLDDAQKKGAVIKTVTDDLITDGSRRMSPKIILSPSEDMAIMQEEIFGPLLPVIVVNSLDEAIAYIQSRPRPLALYYFGKDKQKQKQVIEQTHSGGVTINDTLMHAAIDDMPFGGIGCSGMGHYHGHEGFLQLTKAKSVLIKGKINVNKLIYPPFSGFFKKMVINYLARKK